MSGMVETPPAEQTAQYEARRARMRRSGVAALLPALFLAALYVAAPFAGTSTHAIADRTQIASVTIPRGDSWTRVVGAAAAGQAARGQHAPASVRQPAAVSDQAGFDFSVSHASMGTLFAWYGGIAVLAVGVLALAAFTRRPTHD